MKKEGKICIYSGAFRPASSLFPGGCMNKSPLRGPHYHTAGVPGRHELDDTQKLDYKAIMTVIAETGFTGIVAYKFGPKGDPMTSLRQAF